MVKLNEVESMIPKMESAAKDYATSLMDCVFEEIAYPIKCHETGMGFDDLEYEFNSYMESMTNNVDPYWIVENNMSDDDKCLFWDFDDEGYDVIENLTEMVVDYVENHKVEYIMDLKDWYVDFNAKECLSSPLTFEHLEHEKDECGEDFNLDYSVGNCIYNYCGDGSDDHVRNWVDAHKSEIKEKFERLIRSYYEEK